MVRRAVALAVTAGALSCTAVALAASGDSATGGAHITIGGENRTFAFTARERDGLDRGQAQLQARQTDTRAHIEIDCLRVTGNKAVLGGVVTQTNDGVVDEGDRVLFTVVDNGEGGNAPPDVISLVFYTGVGTFDCETQEAFPDRPVERGNVQVREGG